MERYWFVSRSCIVSSSAVSERVAGVHVGWAPEALPVLHHLIQLGPFIDVLLAHNVRVNEQVAVPHAEVLLAGCTLEALQVVYFVLHPHRHFEGSDPLVARGAQSVLAEQPEVVPSAQFAPQLVVKSPPDLAQPAPTQVTAQAVFVPVLINGL